MTLGRFAAAILAAAILGIWLFGEHRPPPAPPSVDPQQPVYVQAETVLCPPLLVLITYANGHRAGGEREADRRVAALFRHAGGTCQRTFRAESVRVVEMKPDAWAIVEWRGETMWAPPWRLRN